MKMSTSKLLYVQPAAKETLSLAHFNEKLYVNYLLERGVPEEEIDKFELYIGHWAVNSALIEQPMVYYEPRQYRNRDPYDTHSIYIRPIPAFESEELLGDALRHVTEHFINQMRFQKVLDKICKVSLSMSAGAGLGLAWAHLPEHPGVLDMVRGALEALGTTVLGTVGLSMPLSGLANIIRHTGLDEVLAQRAETRQQDALPDGTLRLQFKD